MDIINNPHDKFFKETLGNVSVVQDFIQNYLPENILGIIDINTIAPLKDSFIEKELQELFADLLFGVTINGEDGYLYFLFEHKSYPAKNISFQLLKYMLEIWDNKLNKEKTDVLPIIIPLVIYHGREKWNTEKTLGNLLAGYNDLSVDIQKHVPNYEYILYDFSLYNNEEIKGEAQLRIFLDILKHIFDKDVEQLMSTIERAAQVLSELETKQTGMEYFETYMRYIISARDDLSIEKISERLSNEGRKKLMTVAEQLRREGQKEEKLEVAKKMLQLNMDEEQIIAVTGLTDTVIKQIKDKIN